VETSYCSAVRPDALREGYDRLGRVNGLAGGGGLGRCALRNGRGGDVGLAGEAHVCHGQRGGGGAGDRKRAVPVRHVAPTRVPVKDLGDGATGHLLVVGFGGLVCGGIARHEGDGVGLVEGELKQALVLVLVGVLGDLCQSVVAVKGSVELAREVVRKAGRDPGLLLFLGLLLSGLGVPLGTPDAAGDAHDEHDDNQNHDCAKHEQPAVQVGHAFREGVAAAVEAHATRVKGVAGVGHGEVAPSPAVAGTLGGAALGAGMLPRARLPGLIAAGLVAAGPCLGGTSGRSSRRVAIVGGHGVSFELALVGGVAHASA